MHTKLSPLIWIPVAVVGLFETILTSIILHKERQKRKLSNTLFTTKYLKLWSYCCIICGPTISVSLTLSFFSPFCYFIWYIQFLASFIQSIFLGYYQLSRLYYCFSQNQVYSNNGYPNWLFIIMYCMGLLSVLYAGIFPIGTNALAGSSECGINDKCEFYRIVDITVVPVQRKLRYIVSLIVLYYSWQTLILFLYAYKLRSFQNSKIDNKAIQQRITSIMYRIFVPSIFYQITILFMEIILFCIVHLIFEIDAVWLIIIMVTITPVIYSYSMYIMMQHNTEEYQRFIKTLYRCKLYYCCCCFKNTFVQQVQELNVDQEQLSNGMKENDEKTAYETHDISTNHAKIEPRSIASFPTKSSID